VNRESIERSVRDLAKVDPAVARLLRDVLLRQREFLRRIEELERRLAELVRPAPPD